MAMNERESTATSNDSTVSNDNPKSLAGGIVKIVVGNDRQEFYAHKSLLLSKSSYFRTSLKECWNGKNDEVVFDYIEPPIFETFLTWLYYESFQTPLDGNKIRTSNVGGIYKLADTLMISRFKNDIVDAIIDSIKNVYVAFAALSDLSSLGLEGTALYDVFFRSSIRDFMTSAEKFNDDDRDFRGIDEANLGRKILLGIRDYQKESWNNVWKDKKCKYHDHSDGSTCEMGEEGDKNKSAT